MADFYANLAATALRLLTKYGQTVTVTRDVVGTVDPITGAGTPGTPVTFTGKAAIFDYNVSLIDGVMIQASDKRMVIESTNEPQTSDVVTTATGDFTVVAVNPLSPAGTVVKYDVQIRS